MSEDEWNELITPGAPLNKHWLSQLDVVAVYLKNLRDAHVPVLWRPFHEMNGNWFWWGGKRGERGVKAIWRLEYDHFVKDQRLDNLIWVWSPNTPDGNAARGSLAEYYPGPDYVDVLAMDVYTSFKQEFYDELMNLAAGKPIALGEVGKLPSSNVFESQPRWVWFLEWDTMLTGNNKTEDILAIYENSRTLSRGQVSLKNEASENFFQAVKQR